MPFEAEAVPEQALINKQFMDAVADLWAKIRETHPEVSAADLRISPESNRIVHKLAHWRLGVHELALFPNLIECSAETIAAIIVHEATHALAEARSIVDASDRGRHHNAKFTQLSAEMGLHLVDPRTANIGASDLTVHAEAWYAGEIEKLEAALETLAK